MIAKDIMTRDIITVAPTMTVKKLGDDADQESDQRRPGRRQERQDRRHRLRESDIIAKKGKDVKAIMSKTNHQRRRRDIRSKKSPSS